MFDTYDTSTSVLPEDLDGHAPGPELAEMLGAVNVSELDSYDRVLVLRAHQRLASHFQAQVYRDMVSISRAWEVESDPEDIEAAYGAAEAEIGTALRLTRRAATIDLGFASGLLALPAVFSALLSGRIDRRRAGVLVKGLASLPPETAQSLAAEVIERASQSTSGQLAAYLRKRSLEADPDLAQRRYEEALAERRLDLEASEEGTAHISGYDLPAQEAVAALHRITEIAFSLTGNDDRTLDQVRADVFLDLLLGKVFDHGMGRGTIDLLVDLATLVGLAETPGELGGFGPVIADICRQVAAEQLAGGVALYGDRPRLRAPGGQRHYPPSPHPEPASLRRGSKSSVRLSRLSDAGHELRPRPSSALWGGRPDCGRQPGPALSPSSHAPA